MAKLPKNYISSAFWLIFFVIIILLALNYIPQPFIEKYNLRSIDILSDIRKDTIPQQVEEEYIEPPKLDTCRTGLVCFDDYTPQNKGLDSFYEKLDNINKINRPIRIAFFGDSFIEGDILSGDLREKLQQRFGGKGVGMMPLTSQTNGFRQTVTHSFKGWTTRNFLDYNQTNRLGISGNLFQPNEGAWVSYTGVTRKTNLDTCQRVSIFYNLESGNGNLYYKLNKGESNQVALTQSDKVERLDIDGKCGNIGISFSSNSALSVYGISLEDTTGIIVDNFSMRGISGTILKGLSTEKLGQFNDLLHYDLIILEYGLNVLEANRTNYEQYGENMIETIQHLQACFPETDFLLIGISDRSMRKNGQYQTMPAVPAMLAVQKKICVGTGIVFWNLYEAMGGENSMLNFVQSSPPRANKDYTHLTFKGGEYIGNLLFETFIYEKERYDEKKAYLEKINSK